MIDPGHLHRNDIAPPVHIEGLVANHQDYQLQEHLRLPPLIRNLEIDYTALSFSVPRRVRFRYWLEGYDAGWQDPGTRRQAFYNDLRPGKYRFRVIACNNDGVWNETGEALDFSIAPAWYQTGWFMVLSVASGILIVWMLYRLRVQQVAAGINARFDERLDERTRMAREFHDTLLQTIQGSKMVADDALDQPDPDRMRHALERVSTWMGQATEEGRAALNSLRASTTQRNDLAEALQRAVDDCLAQASMDGSFSIEGTVAEMHPIVRDEIYRIGYEAIRNACLHSGATRLAVQLRYAQDLVLSVHDNGKGIDSDILTNGKEGHFGLQGMRERATRIGAKLNLSSSSDSGTAIVLTVPGNVIFQRENLVRTFLIKIKGFFRK
jgi:signal transduction histidine kinase